MIISSYILMRYLTTDNTACELYVSQWLKLLIEYSVGPWNHEGLGLRKALQVLMLNNEIISNKRIDKNIIENYVNLIIDQGYDERYVELLRVVCICNDKPVKENQKHITNSLFGNPEKRNKLIFGLKFIGNEVMVKDPFQLKDKNAWIPLAEFKKYCLDKDNHINILRSLSLFQKNNTIDIKRCDKHILTYNYFASMLYLLGDVCRDRNKRAIEILRANYDIKSTFYVIKSERYSKELRSGITYLAEHLHVNLYPFEKIQYPIMIKFWNRDDSISLQVKHILSKDYEDLQKYVYRYLNNKAEYLRSIALTTKFKDLCVFERIEKEDLYETWNQEGELMLRIIDLCKTMIDLGFFSKPKRFRKIFDALLSMLEVTDTLGSEITEYRKSIQKKNVDSLEEKTSFEKFVEELDNPETDQFGMKNHFDFIKIKQTILTIMKIIMNIQIDLKINLFYNKCKETFVENSLSSIFKGSEIFSEKSFDDNNSILNNLTQNDNKTHLIDEKIHDNICLVHQNFFYCLENREVNLIERGEEMLRV